MPCIEICASPIQDDHETSLAKGSPEDPQSDGTAGYVSDESVRFATVSFQDTDILIVLYGPTRTQIPPTKLTQTARSRTTMGSNIAGQAHLMISDSR